MEFLFRWLDEILAMNCFFNLLNGHCDDVLGNDSLKCYNGLICILFHRDQFGGNCTPILCWAIEHKSMGTNILMIRFDCLLFHHYSSLIPVFFSFHRTQKIIQLAWFVWVMLPVKMAL